MADCKVDLTKHLDKKNNYNNIIPLKFLMSNSINTSIIMENEIKKIPPLLTMLEVWFFMRNPRHSIPAKHHINMVRLQGCSLKQLRKYLQWRHSLSDDAVTTLVSNPECMETLLMFMARKPYLLSNKHIAMLHERFGAEWLMERLPHLYADETARIIAEGSIEIIRGNLDRLLFGKEEEAMLLKLLNPALTSEYLSVKKHLKRENASLLLSYTEHEVFEAYFKNGMMIDEICSEVVNNKPLHIFKLMCRYCELPTSMQKLLIDNANLEKINVYVKWRQFDASLLGYLVQNSSDEVFEFCIQNRLLSGFQSETLYQRLFEEKNKKLLKAYVEYSPLLSAAWEIKLLTSGDKELAAGYAGKHKLSSAAAAYLLSHGLGKQFNVSVKDIAFPDWEAESILFKQGSDELVKKRLFGGGELPELTDFGEGMLFTRGSIDILTRYMKAKTCGLSIQAQRALLIRHDTSLINLFLENDDFDMTLMPLFIKTADVQIVISCLIARSTSSNAKQYNSAEIACALCERGNNILVNYALMHCTFDEYADKALVQYAPEKYILQRFTNEPLTPKAEAELLRKGSKKLLKQYFSQHTLHAENELVLLNCYDEDLVTCYLLHHSLANANAKRQLCL